MDDTTDFKVAVYSHPDLEFWMYLIAKVDYTDHFGSMFWT